MGVRLVKYSLNNLFGSKGTFDHNELLNRDLADQHPIFAITGLQEYIDKIDIIEKQIEQILKDIEYCKKYTIETFIDGYETIWTRDLDNHTAKVNIKLQEDDDDTNALKITKNGLYSPKVKTQDTNTVEWVSIIHGESLLDIFNTGGRFSHNSSSWSNHFKPSEESSWYWSSSLGSFVQPQNTSYFNGFITKEAYDKYTHRATLRSTDSDDDLNGIIIGHVIDDSGNPHTLSLLVDSGGVSMRYGLVYDYYLPDQQILATCGNTSLGSTIPANRAGAWSSRSIGITMQIEKFQNTITCKVSDWNSTTLNEATTIKIDLNNYSWGSLFIGEVNYGYCNLSQASSFFTNVFFESVSSATSSTLLASVKISEDDENSIREHSDGIYVDGSILNYLSDKNGTLQYKGKEISGGGGAGNVIDITQTAHNFSVGNVLYCDTDGLYKKALAEDSNKIEVVGVVSEIVDADNFKLIISGLLKGFASGLSNGSVVYLSETNPGSFVATSDLVIQKPLGIIVPNGFIINIQRASYNATIDNSGSGGISVNDKNLVMYNPDN